MKKHLFLLLSFLMGFHTQAQKIDSLEMIWTIEQAADKVYADILENYYLIDLDGKLLKINSQGEIINEYQNSKAIPINSIDTRDPLKILCFYRDFELIEFLNDEIDLTGNTLILESDDFGMINQVCKSYNNGLWLFDVEHNMLLLSDLHLRVQNSIEVSYNKQDGSSIEADQLLENGRNIFLIDKSEGVFIWDLFGASVRTLPYAQIKQAQIIEDDLYMLINDRIIIHNIKFNQLRIINLPSTYNTFAVYKQHILLSDNSKTGLYRLNSEIK